LKNNGDLGLLYVRLERPGDAEKYLKTAADIDPTDAEIMASLGFTYTALKKYQDAKSYLKKAAALDQNDARVHSLLGWVYLETGNRTAAITEYNIAAKLDITIAKPLFDRIFGDKVVTAPNPK
jgi:Flp pilus assembly protein TadD